MNNKYNNYIIPIMNIDELELDYEEINDKDDLLDYIDYP